MNESEKRLWWQAYLAVLPSWIQHADTEKADKYSAENADKALERYRAQARQTLVDNAPPECNGCVHIAKSATVAPCNACVCGVGRGEDLHDPPRSNAVHPGKAGAA